MEDFKKKSELRAQEKVDPLDLTREAERFLQNDTNQISLDEKRRATKAKYNCTLAKFACYFGETKGPKNVIVKNRLSSKGGGGQWYREMKPFLRESILKNSLSPIYAGISVLNREPDPEVKDEARNLELSREALEGFLGISYPIEFKQATKTIFKPTIRSFKHGSIELTLNGIHCFRTRYKGEDIVGTILISHLVDPMKLVQMQVATYLMAECVKEHLLRVGEKFDPRFCICLDTRSRTYVTTPIGFEAGKIRSLIHEESEDFIKRWEEKSSN
jgi:hypothetical protein